MTAGIKANLDGSAAIQVGNTDFITTTSGGAVTIPGTLNVTGAVTLSTTLGVAQGGTGQTTYTDGQLLIGNSTGNTLTKATLTAGSGISITNGSGSITIASSGAVTSVAAGAGMNFTTITTSGSVAMGTPSTLTNTTTNSASGTTHTHALTGELVETTAGSPLYYGARAYVNFNGTGTIAIRGSVNVSSLTDNGTGNYTINFSTAMDNTNYALLTAGNGSTVADPAPTVALIGTCSNTTQNTGNCTIKNIYGPGGTAFDIAKICAVVFS